MHIYEKEFDFVIQRAKSLDRPARMVVAGADCENIMKAVFAAQEQGFCQPILVGFKERIIPMLKDLGFYEREYVISDVSDIALSDLSSDYHVYMKRAISTPVTREQASRPPRAAVPSRQPTARGATTARMPGTSISCRAAWVEMATQEV